MNTKSVTEAKNKVKIPQHIIDELEAIPDKNNIVIPWTPEMEEVVRVYYATKSAQKISEILSKMSGKKITLSAVYRKVREFEYEATK